MALKAVLFQSLLRPNLASIGSKFIFSNKLQIFCSKLIMVLTNFSKNNCQQSLERKERKTSAISILGKEVQAMARNGRQDNFEAGWKLQIDRRWGSSCHRQIKICQRTGWRIWHGLHATSRHVANLHSSHLQGYWFQKVEWFVPIICEFA